MGRLCVNAVLLCLIYSCTFCGGGSGGVQHSCYGRVTWYEAVVCCRSREEFIPHGRNRTELSELAHLVRTEYLTSVWLHTYISKEENTTSEGADSEFRCSVLQVAPDRFYVEGAPCTATRRFLCVPGTVRYSFDQSSPTAPLVKEMNLTFSLGTSPGPNNSVSEDAGDGENRKLLILIILSSLMTLAALVSVATLTIYCLKAKRNNQHRRPDLEVAEPLAGKAPPPVADDPRSVLQRLLCDRLGHLTGIVHVWSWKEETISYDINNIPMGYELCEIHGDASDRREKKISHYLDLFGKDYHMGSAKSVNLYGETGTGKTTILKKILADWRWLVTGFLTNRSSKETNNVFKRLGRFDIVVPIFLRHADKCKNLIDILTIQLNITESDAGRLVYYIEHHPEKVLIVIDDVPGKQDGLCDDIKNILNRSRYKRASLLVTSQEPLPVDYGFQKYASLKGFGRKGIVGYVNTFPGLQGSGHVFVSETERTEGLTVLAGSPAVLPLLCILWRDTKNVGISMTGFYKAFIAYMCGRHERECLNEYSSESDDYYITKYHTDLMLLGQCALESLQKDGYKDSIYLPNVQEKLARLSEKYGLFRREPDDRSHVLSFLHWTLQEFLMAYFIVNSESDRQMELLAHICDVSLAVKATRFVTTFVMGLGGNLIWKQIIESVQKSNPNHMSRTKCELQLAVLCQFPDLKCKLAPVVEFEIKGFHTAKVLQSYFSMDGSDVREVKMWTPEVKYSKYLTELKAPNLTKLSIIFSDSPYTNAVHMAPPDVKVRKAFPLSCLNINGFVNMDIVDTKVLLDLIGESSTIDILNLSDAKHLMLGPLVPVISKQAGLKELLLRNCGISITTSFITCLSQTPKLEVLDLYGNFDVERGVFELLGKQLQNLSKLRRLHLCHCYGQYRRGVRTLVEQIKHTPLLQVLEMGRDSLDSSGLRALADQFSGLQSLQELHLRRTVGTSADIDDWVYCISCLKNLPGLTLLDLSYNNIGDQSIRTLSLHLRLRSSIDTLRLRKCGLKLFPDVLNDLTDAASMSSAVNVIDVSENVTEGDVDIYHTIKTPRKKGNKRPSSNEQIEQMRSYLTEEAKQKLPNVIFHV